jgi:hypothetical protein
MAAPCTSIFHGRLRESPACRTSGAPYVAHNCRWVPLPRRGSGNRCGQRLVPWPSDSVLLRRVTCGRCNYMTHRWTWFAVAPVILILGIAGVFLAQHEGTTTGTPPDLSTPAKKDCPSGPPDACREMIAGLLRVDAQAVPTLAESTDGLQFQKGYVLLDKTGTNQPTAVFEYASSPGQSSFETFHLVIAPHVAPTHDDRPVGTTPSNRTFRIVRTNLGTIGLVFNDEHFAYIIQRGFSADLSQTPHELALAEHLVDAVHLTTRQLNPPTRT